MSYEDSNPGPCSTWYRHCMRDWYIRLIMCAGSTKPMDCNLFSGSCYIKMFFTLLTLVIHNNNLLALLLQTVSITMNNCPSPPCVTYVSVGTILFNSITINNCPSPPCVTYVSVGTMLLTQSQLTIALHLLVSPTSVLVQCYSLNHN